jgi:hypothetical protein
MRSKQRPQRDPLIKQMVHHSNHTQFGADPAARADMLQPRLPLGMRQQVGPLGSGQVLLKPPAQIPAQPEGREAQEATGIRDSPIVG